VYVEIEQASAERREQGNLDGAPLLEWGEKISRLLAGGALGELTVPEFGVRSGYVPTLARRPISIIW
jgi:hypothetical protein